MEYAQLTPDGLDATQITTHGNIEWDANNFCTAEALVRDGKAEQFGVVPLTVIEPPDYNPATHAVVRDGCELVAGEWRYKWRVDALTPEQIEAAYRAAAKAAREIAVSQIKVTTLAGNTFDGDEISQGRMARAILVLASGQAATVTWVLADNTVIDVSAAELTAALALAGAAQAAMWVIP